ncbi:PREDICTED: transcriptional regulatory protein AlgP-like [Gekko japonicus]|uniref:Transcriptional regulatory protein AlgP-like n=1 Tax=Gekko japonicus TaxID=146911 RepID=A0ABM1JVN3_GEKJA|nr:PREDICTED: transcriptional regulatory protein AlgP-like [Gekko japonicus]
MLRSAAGPSPAASKRTRSATVQLSARPARCRTLSATASLFRRLASAATRVSAASHTLLPAIAPAAASHTLLPAVAPVAVSHTLLPAVAPAAVSHTLLPAVAPATGPPRATAGVVALVAAWVAAGVSLAPVAPSHSRLAVVLRTAFGSPPS